jgi:hypothetical protein
LDGGVLLVEAGQHRRIGCVGNERNGLRMRRVAEMAKKGRNDGDEEMARKECVLANCRDDEQQGVRRIRS